MFIKWLVTFWFLSCLAGVLYLSENQLTDFDPELKLSTAIADTGYEQKLLNQLQKIHPDIDKSLLHFTNKNCFCETIADNHIRQFSADMDVQGFKSIYIDLHQFPELADYIPSTPSVAIVGMFKELIYLGPYSEGYACLQSTSLVDGLITKINSISIENTILVTEAKGCYCNT
ncbi:DUF6436 domain-containing protein [Paraglaciecola sp. L3A3]|uniref:DUF6436 domain-containing protein n=1 Tax=Paraglaciecola sp. L3A3 TaxID=2686358 RepID=UPI00131AF7F4|nr:DUF6436 domain-containing protein [Paraglaciecola sp. L3A3]